MAYTMKTWKTFDNFRDLPEGYREAVDEYILHGNKTKAFEKTLDGGEDDFKTRKSLSVRALNFFKLPNINAIVEARQQQLAELGSMEKQDIIRRIELIAKGEAPDQFADTTSVKDQLQALNMLCKITGIIDDKAVVTTNIQQVFVDDVRE